MPASTIRVTIAMPCLNEAAFIEACLGSVRAQTYPADRTEILVADGGSSDGTTGEGTVYLPEHYL